ncbi:MAG: hypothetical protein JWQ86_2013, partial [Mycobacterium sp.]|nr:hypothetical protein [Mycobacterium sp.]
LVARHYARFSGPPLKPDLVARHYVRLVDLDRVLGARQE